MQAISAREFYTLQKMKRQGKLNNNPKASALIDEISRTLSSKKGAPTLESLLQPPVTDQSPPTTKAGKKRNKKKKSKPSASEKQNIVQNSDSSKHAAIDLSLLNESALASGKLSRNQRRKLRKKLRASDTLQQTTTDTPNAGELSAKAGQKRVCPESPIHTDEKDVQSTKKQRTNENSLSVSPKRQVQEKPSEKSVEDIPSLLPAEPADDTTVEWNLEDPLSMGKEEFATIIAPVTVDDFFTKYFEKHPLRVQRNNAHYDDWLSTRDIDLMLRKQRVMFGEHLDLASYKDGQRYTLNPPGRAFRSVVWDHYNQMGCSVRLLCPQVFFSHIRYRLGLLQEYFGCFVGANVYLTPPGSQGFAPHYDDIEAFIMQLEGSKNWKVYAPRTPSETLPRESSPNFTQEELGKPMMTVTLKPGDLLYLPRGYIHQGTTPDNTHSLHLTISTYQKHTWGDFLTKLMPIALQSAMETEIEFRRGLPLGFLRHVGGFSVAADTPSTQKNKNEASKCEDQLRRGVVQRLRQLADRIEQSSRTGKLAIRNEKDLESESPDPLLVASDQMAVDLIAQSLPPQLREDELCCHVQKQGEHWTRRRTPEGSTAPVPGGVVDVVELEPDTEVRLVRWSAVRALRTRISSGSHSDSDEEDNEDEEAATSGTKSNLVVAMYHSLSNTNVYKERELEELALDIKHLPALDCLTKAFPDFVAIQDLPLDSLEEKMDAAIGLYEAGFLVTRYPLPPTDEAASSDDEDDEPGDDESGVDSLQVDSESDADGGERGDDSEDAESVERLNEDASDTEDDDEDDESVEEIGEETSSEGSDDDEDDMGYDEDSGEEDENSDDEEDDAEFNAFLQMHEDATDESSDSSVSEPPISAKQKAVTATQAQAASKKQDSPGAKKNRKRRKNAQK